MASHYRDAAKCLKAVDGGRTTLKTAAYKTQNPPRTVALVSEVRRHRKALETAIAATGPCRWVRESSKWSPDAWSTRSRARASPPTH